uniref:DISC1 scaffold protein n=1 Tax=Cynoglossus semilaevis TaxID=244447 RepID=A0A3P8W4R9_CYNSE
MFAGLLGLDCHNKSLLHLSEGGRASTAAASSGRKRLHRRPGYMRGEQSRLQSPQNGWGEEEEEEEEEDEGRTLCMSNGKTGCPYDLIEATCTHRTCPTPAVVSFKSQSPTGKLTCSTRTSQSAVCLVTPPLSNTDCRKTSASSLPPPLDSFSSSFSFIQQSLNSRTNTTTAVRASNPEPLINHTSAPTGSQPKPETVYTDVSTNSAPVQSLSSSVGQSEREELSLGVRFWRECPWDGREATTNQPDCDSEITSSLSVDSDTASASSVTSGYESATPASDHCWEILVRKYDVVLQDCLQNNRTHTKIESMMLKLQRLQQKSILDDDYDAAERFGKKLEELNKERGDLQLGLPSLQPCVALFLERLRQVVNSALQRAEYGQRREGAGADGGERSESLQGPLHQRDLLVQEKRRVEEEMTELQRRLAELKDRSRCLEQQIQQQEQQVEAKELEGSVLKSCNVAQLCDVSRSLRDLVTSENRMQISVALPPSILRLQEQEQALNLSIKEATAKVVMSQRLGSSLRRKVSETETQLLALHEAKLAAISGNDFSSAKELKAEMKAVHQERDRLESLAKRLHSLSSGSSQELARMKEQRQQLRQELEQREAGHESRLKENTTKYIELLEDRLHSFGCPGLERIWEADLEACHLFLRGLQLRTPSCGGAEVDDLPPPLPRPAAAPPAQPSTKEEEEDCAMLTALGGRWCPDANLQNSEFTKLGPS